MKLFSVFFSVFLGQFLLGNVEVEPFRAQYEILSDVKDSYITNGRCILEISVRDKSTNMELQNVIIKSGKKKHVTNSIGFAKFSQPISIKHLEFNLENYATGYVEGYEFKSKHRIKINVFLVNQMEEIHYNVKKPVIYCYSDTNLNFNFKFKLKGSLLFTYPVAQILKSFPVKKGLMDEGITYFWNMGLKEGHLINSNDKLEYPYLFWESVQGDINFKLTAKIPAKRGFDGELNYDGEIVSRNNIVNYLDSTLTCLGLNSNEKTDFITFWGPQMMKRKFYLIQFLQDSECEQFASYEIRPFPAKVNRLYLLFSGFDQINPAMKTKKQALTPMERKGFYMVDWGGVEVPLFDWTNDTFPQKEVDVNNSIIKN